MGRSVENRAIPDGWRVVRLGDVAKVETGGTPSRSKPSYWGGSVPWMASGEINQRRVMWTAEHVTQAGLDSSNAKEFPKGTVMLAMNGQGATRGKVALLGIEAACNQSLAAITGNRTDNPFLFQLLWSSYDHLRALTGDGRSGLNLGLIRSLPILLPPPSEQRAIAAVLDSIDEAIERTEAVIAATERLRDALLHELLTRGVPGWHSEWKHAPGIGTIPACWDVVQLGDVADVKGGKRLPKGASFTDTCMEFPYIRVVDFSNRTVDSRDIQFLAPEVQRTISRYTISRNDVYVSIAGTIGLVGLVPDHLDGANLTENAAKLVIDLRSQLSNYLLMSFLDSHSGQSQISRRVNILGQPKLALERIRTIALPIPTPTEQGVIVESLQSIDTTIERRRDSADVLRSLKASTCDALLTGRVRTKLPFKASTGD